MRTSEELIEQFLPREAITSALRSVLAATNGSIELEDGELPVDTDGELEVVARSLHTYGYDIGFGNHFRALVAVGGVKCVEHGVPEAGGCFATLYFSSDAKLITVDFSSRMP